MTRDHQVPAPVADDEFETADPIAALDHKSIAVRAAACRDLTKMGTVEHLARLAQSAGQDKSPAVRLGTAAAASDILSRRRLDSPDRALTMEERSRILDLFKRVDPALNPGVFSIFGTVDTAAGLSRIRIGLRDPRQEVRKGAGVGLMRLCISQARFGDADLEAEVVQMLTDRRMRPDAVAEVARVCQAAGFGSALTVLERLDLGGVHQDEVDHAIGQLGLAGRRPLGAWLSDGRDAGEMRVEPVRPPALLVVGPSGGWCKSSGEAWISVDLAKTAWRRMYYRAAGTQEAAPALQLVGRTFHHCSKEALPGVVDVHFPAQAVGWPHSASRSEASASLAALLEGEGPTDARARALLLGDAGDFAGAAADLDRALGQKNAPADVRYLLGWARAAAGDESGARAAWQACVEKARRKKDWFVVAAKERLALG